MYVLAYALVFSILKTSRASRQGWVRQSADRPYEPKFHEANNTVIMSFGKRFPFPVFRCVNKSKNAQTERKAKARFWLC